MKSFSGECNTKREECILCNRHKKGGTLDMLKKIGRGAFVIGILGFVLGLLMAFFLPPVVIAVVECVVIVILCIALKKC